LLLEEADTCPDQAFSRSWAGVTASPVRVRRSRRGGAAVFGSLAVGHLAHFAQYS
jgi:hypothetical protein